MKPLTPGPIEQGVPQPPHRYFTRRGDQVDWQFHDMKKGDSFATDPACREPSLLRVRIAVAALRYGQDRGQRYTVRVVIEDGHEVVRCWRVR